MPDNSEFPSGTYRVVVIDSGGDRDTREFYLPASVPFQKKPVVTLLESGSFVIDSPFKENYLMLKNGSGAVVKSMKVVSGTIPVELVLKGIQEKIHTFALYSVDTVSNTGYIILVDNKYSF
jgi:hypothetical protein